MFPIPLEAGPLNTARESDSLGSVVSYPSEVWGGASAKIQFGALLALKSDIWWHLKVRLEFETF